MSKKSEEKKLWGGRFSGSTETLMETFSESVSFDQRLFAEDIQGSLAHAEMLQSVGIISEQDLIQIRRGLLEIKAEIAADRFQWSMALEDMHMNIEAALTERIGEAGKRLHSARSRNDQVATDMRLYLRREIDAMCKLLTSLQRILVRRAAAEADTIMPGFTHMQPAQPVTLGHHLLAWNEMFERDYARLQECRHRVNISPLGCAALAGTTFPVDREMTARLLGFSAVAGNSLDAVSDRDFIIEFSSHCALLMVHLSRIAEELVLWSTPLFGFADLGDGFCTGSSIMPQKRNPDVAELTRGKSARAIGNLTALLTLMKSQPLAYNRDNQEDKEPLFDSIDTGKNCLAVFAGLLRSIQFNREKMYDAASTGHSTATDLADYLVKKALPFREAHEVTGRIVAEAERQNTRLENLSLETMRNYSSIIEDDVYDILSVEGSVAARDHVGGTAPSRVAAAVKQAHELLDARALL